MASHGQGQGVAHMDTHVRRARLSLPLHTMPVRIISDQCVRDWGGGSLGSACVKW